MTNTDTPVKENVEITDEDLAEMGMTREEYEDESEEVGVLLGGLQLIKEQLGEDPPSDDDQYKAIDEFLFLKHCANLYIGFTQGRLLFNTTEDGLDPVLIETECDDGTCPCHDESEEGDEDLSADRSLN